MAGVVDARGQVCPLPVLKLRKALLDLQEGDRVELLATDPQAAHDVPAFCAETGDRLVDHRLEAGALWFLVERGASCRSR